VVEKGGFFWGRGVLAVVKEFLANFDRVFAVIADTDAEKLAALGYGNADGEISDGDVEKLVAERQDTRKRRDFAASDRIRKELAERGIILEDSRDGSARWKRK